MPKEKEKKHSFFCSLKQDYKYRTIVFAVVGATATVIYAVVSGVFAFLSESAWYVALCGYLCVLGLERILTLAIYCGLWHKFQNDEKKLDAEKEKIYIANGGFFILVAVTLGAVITLLYRGQKPLVSNDIFAIASAAYAFFKIGAAIVNLKKTKIFNDPVLLTIRNLSFVDAMTSLLLLENTLPSAFGAIDKNIQILIAVTGMAVCIATVAIGIHMIVNGSKNLRRQNTEP